VDIICLLFHPSCLLLFQSDGVSNPCQNNGTCQAGFTNKGYRCLCTAGFRGHNCQKEEVVSCFFFLGGGGEYGDLKKVFSKE